jgi:zinc protease
MAPDSVDRLMDFYALQTSFGGGGESTSSSLNTLTRHLEPALALWGEMLREPRFDPAEVEVWRDRQREGILRRKDDPGRLAFSEFNEIMFGDHPIGWEMEEGDLVPERFSRASLETVHRRTYCRERLLLGVVGDVEWRELSPLLERMTGSWPACTEDLPLPPDPRMRREGGVFIIPRRLAQSTVVMAQPGGIVQGTDQEFFDSRIANSILGASGFTSRIFSRVRTEKGYAYSASSLWTAPSRYEGIVGAVTQTRGETTIAAIRLILETMEEMRREEPSREEVQQAIDQIVNGFVFNFQDPSQVVSRQMFYQAQGLPDDWLERYLDGVQRVRPAGVRRVVERHVHPQDMIILILGDPEAFDLPAETLGKVTIWEVEGLGESAPPAPRPGRDRVSEPPRAAPRSPR